MFRDGPEAGFPAAPAAFRPDGVAASRSWSAVWQRWRRAKGSMALHSEARSVGGPTAESRQAAIAATACNSQPPGNATSPVGLSANRACDCSFNRLPWSRAPVQSVSRNYLAGAGAASAGGAGAGAASAAGAGAATPAGAQQLGAAGGVQATGAQAAGAQQVGAATGAQATGAQQVGAAAGAQQLAAAGAQQLGAALQQRSRRTFLQRTFLQRTRFSQQEVVGAQQLGAGAAQPQP